MSPLVTIIIVNWNGAKILPGCLAALHQQSRQDFEIIVVDNASSDGSVDGLEERWPDLQVLRLEQNLGFAEANNQAAGMAKGKWLALLNNDAFPQADWLAKLLKAAEAHPGFTSFAPRIVRADAQDMLDSAGDIFHITGLAWHRGRGSSVSQMDPKEQEVFSPSGAAALYDKATFLAAGGFDSAYFSHHEDVDLGFRLRLAGHRCLYVPDAVVAHVGSASFGLESDRTVYQYQRNFVWTYFKDMPGSLFWVYLPAHLLANLVFMGYYTLRRQGRVILKAKFDALRGLPAILRRRREIQKTRIVTEGELARVMNHDWLAPYLLGKRTSQAKRILRS